MDHAKVACIGEALTVLVQSTPGPLEHSETFSRSVGGAEFNVAIGLASQGVTTSILTRVGDDGFGRHLLSAANHYGVDVTAVETDAERPTGLYIKEVGGDTADPSDLGPGNSRMVYYRAGSASSVFSPDYLDRHAGTLSDAFLIHTTGITPALSDGARDMALTLATSRPSGQLLSFDVNWRPALWAGREAAGVESIASIARGSDVVFLGRSEALTVFGTADPDEIRRVLSEPRWIVLKDGASAASGFDGDTRVDISALVAPVTEAIGAGDAFASGFLASLVAGESLTVCLENAHRVAILALATRQDHVGVERQ